MVKKNFITNDLSTLKAKCAKKMVIGSIVVSLGIPTFTGLSIVENHSKYYAKQKETYQTYRDTITLYDDITDQIVDVFKELTLTNPAACYAVFKNLLRSGAIGGKNPEGISDTTLDIYEHEGIDLLLEEGCCRSASEMLHRCLEKMGYESYLVVNYLPPTKATREDTKKEANHLVVVVPYQDEIYILDPINNSYYLLNSLTTALNPIRGTQIEFRMIGEVSQYWMDDMERVKLYMHLIFSGNSPSVSEMNQYMEEGTYKMLQRTLYYHDKCMQIEEKSKELMKTIKYK